jgi:DNA invertase Pin-like site-specific DNA recombinase
VEVLPRAAAIYTRISLDRSGEGLGVARQEADCRRLATERGWHVHRVYPDNDLSGSARGVTRPEYDQLCADIAAGIVDAVICWDLDRLTRQPRQLEEFVELCDRAGVRHLATVSGDIHIGTGDGLLVARIKGAVAAEEARKIRQRVARKQQELAERGLPGGGGKRPLGFQADRITHDPTEAAALRYAVDVVLTGGTLADAAADVSSRLARPVDPSSLRRVLVSPRLAGLRQRHGAIVGEAKWAPIIEPETQERLRATLAGRYRYSRPYRAHLLGGIARCGAPGCDAKLHAQVVKGRREGLVQYSCRRARGGCGRVAVTADILEGEVLAEVQRWLQQPEFAAAIAAAVDGDPQGDLDDLAAQVVAAEAALESLARERQELGLEVAEWKALREPIAARLDAARRTLSEARQRSGPTPFSGVTPAELAELWPALAADPATMRELIRLLVGEIRVRPVGKGWRSAVRQRVQVVPAWSVSGRG